MVWWWGMGRNFKEGTYIYIWLIHFIVLKKLTWCKTIIQKNGLVKYLWARGKEKNSNFLFCINIWFHQLLKRQSSPHWVFLAPLSNVIWSYKCGFISGLSVMFHWSMCLFILVLYFLIIIILWSSLKLWNIMSLALFFLKFTF